MGEPMRSVTGAILIVAATIGLSHSNAATLPGVVGWLALILGLLYLAWGGVKDNFGDILGGKSN